MSRAPRYAVLLLAVLACRCGGSYSPARPTPPAADPAPADPGPNALTPAEIAAGWRLLFDGRTTNGWRGFRQGALPAGWQVVDAALTRVDAAGDIISNEQFANFELTLEWQIVAGGNSGVMYRVSESASELTFFSGPEMQVIDNAANPEGATALSSAGACYAIYAPSVDVMRPAGSWNAARIVADGSRIEHWLNGTRVVAYEIGSDDWLARVRASIFRDVPTYGRQASGHLALQDHGERVAYRSIKIRTLP